MMKSWLGLPEEDGGIPVLIIISTPSHHFTFIDTLGRKEEPILSIDTPDIHRTILEKFQTHFYEVDERFIVEICSRAYALLDQESETWAIVKQFLPISEKLPPLPALMDVQDIDVSGLMKSDKGICIAIPDNVLLEGLKGIQLVKKNHDDTNTDDNKKETVNVEILIEAVVNTTADLALKQMHREWWVLVMESMGVIHDRLQSYQIAQTARVNARYFQIHRGSEVPILKNWAEHFLLRGTAMARISTKHNLMDKK